MKPLVALLVLTHVAAADMRRSVEPMRVADGAVCGLLLAQNGDRCAHVLDDKRATVYRSGTASGITRVVVALPAPDGAVLVGPSLDLEAVGKITPAIHDVTIDGRAGVAVEIVAMTDHREVHAVVGCAPSGDKTAYKCEMLDAGTCDLAVGPTGTVTSAACGDARLSLR